MGIILLVSAEQAVIVSIDIARPFITHDPEKASPLDPDLKDTQTTAAPASLSAYSF